MHIKNVLFHVFYTSIGLQMKQESIFVLPPTGIDYFTILLLTQQYSKLQNNKCSPALK